MSDTAGLTGLAAAFPGIAQQGSFVFVFVALVSLFGFGFQASLAKSTLAADSSLSPFFSAVTVWNIVSMALVLAPLTFIGVLPLPPFLSIILPIPAVGPTLYTYPAAANTTYIFMFLVFSIHSVSNTCRPLYHAYGKDTAIAAAKYAAAYPLLLLLPIASGASLPFILFIMIFSEIGQHMVGGGWWFLQYRKDGNETAYYGVLSVLLHLTGVLPWLGYMIFSGPAKSGKILFGVHTFMMGCMFASQNFLVETAKRTKDKSNGAGMF